MHAETLAPHRLLSSKAISLQDASLILDKYLANSEVHPHLHPDALITPSGTTFSAQGGPAGGVVMHNLHRIAAGLKGNYLEPEPTPEPEGEEQHVVDGTNNSQEDSTGKNGPTAAPEDWQDMSEFEREEGAIEVGEVGDRSTFVAQEEIEEAGHLSGEGKKRKKDEEGGKLDKAARKKAKKAKDKEFRAQKEKARADKSA